MRMKSMLRKIRKLPQKFRKKIDLLCRLIREQRLYQVQFYNVWDGQTHDEMYWFRFLKDKRLLENHKSIAVFSCFGDRGVIEQVKSDVKIFISGENLKDNHYAQFADHCLGSSEIDFAMGHEVFDNPRYVRFPVWMDRMFAPECTPEDIRTICSNLRYPIIEKNKFCCMIASHGAGGFREQMFYALSDISTVDSAGRYLHNDDSLRDEFGDVKIDYMRQYLFNICPENSSAYGYTTEKLFDAISAGCIPVYWGADLADKEVINKDAIIFWDKENNGKEAIRQIGELYSNPKLLEAFLKQPRLMPTAEECILDTFATIEDRLRTIINSK